jgi:ABC-type nitrate/sulfonate/bicarbonate transport system permease component
MNRKMMTRAISIGGLIVYWFVVTHYKLVNPLFLPPPKEVWEGAVDLFQAGELTEHISVSLWRMAKGFVVGSFTGVIIGILMGQFRLFHAAVGPLVEIIRPVPGLAWIPVALIWFGIEDASKVFIISMGVFIAVVTNTFVGVRSLDPVLARAARSLGANRRDIFFRVVLPGALPYIFTGFRLGVQVSFALLVAAELVGSTSGLGFLIQDARNYFRGDLVILGMAVIGTLGFSITRLVEIAGRWFLRWHSTSREGAFY